VSTKHPATHYAENMRRLKARGWTFERIGRRYGVSKQRVAQIIGNGKP